MTTETLQILTHIPNSRARQAELQYRLTQLNRPQRVQMLCLALDDPYPPLRHDVAEALQIELGRGERAVEALDAEVTRLLEAVVSDQVPDASALTTLMVPIELVPRGSMRARMTACVALEASPYPERTADLLLPLLRAENEDLRYQALIATHRLVPDSPRLHEAVLAGLEDPDPEIVVVATQIAVLHGWADLLPQFLHARARLRGEDRVQITFSVGELIDNSSLTAAALPEEARQDIIAECHDALDHEPHTAAAIRTLANLEAQEATDKLAKMAKGWFVHPILKVEAAAALVDLGDLRGQEYLEKALSSRRKDARGYALRIAGDRKLPQYLDHLIEVARSDDYHADTATLALADFGGDRARSVLAELAASHGDAEVRELARTALQE